MTIKFDEGKTKITADDLHYYEGDRLTLIEDVKGVSKIIIPDSVTEIGDYAFADCYSLKSITVPDSVTEIGKEAFLNCESLESIIVPNSVTEIGKEAFRFCESKDFLWLLFT